MSSENYIYALGDYSLKRGKEKNVISIFDAYSFELLDTIKISDKNVSIHQIVVNRDTNQIYASGSYLVPRGRRIPILNDTVYFYNITSHDFERIDLYDEIDDGKEGGLGDIAYNPNTETIYVSSVYVHGGVKVLYSIDNRSNRLKNSIRMDRYGPLGLDIDYSHNLVYALGTDYKGNSYIVEIDGSNDKIKRRIELPRGIHSISPYSRYQNLTGDYERNRLYVVLEDQLYKVDLYESDFGIEKLPFDDYEFRNI